jgi:uncharacterized protein (TIGR03118 family)
LASRSAGTIEAYNSSFAPAGLPGNFTDPNLPQGYAPFNDKVIDGGLYVTYAKQDADKHDDEAGAGNGFVDIFNLDGTLKERLISRGALDSPWGLQIAPSSFGSFAGDLLVGNFGNGMINAYNATTGAFVGALDGSDGSPLVIDGLWGLTIGNGEGRQAEASTLCFSLRGPTAKVTACSGVWRFPNLRLGLCCCWASAPSASPPIAGRKRRLASPAPDWRPILQRPP